VYHKANVLGLQTFIQNRFAIWASNGRCVGDVWNNFKSIILKSTERLVPYKIPRKKLGPEYYNKSKN
jgi:hypothetical protein